MRPKSVYRLAFGLALACAVTAVQPAAAQVAQLDAIAGAAVREIRSVGIAAAVARGNDTLLLQAYGQADVQAGTPLMPYTVLAIGSATKQFTAAAILQLRDAGKLSLDDEITKWFPEMQTGGQKVTLRHLLWHTAGIVDLVDIAELREKQLLRNPTLTRADVYQAVAREPLRFSPGSMQAYSNTGYWLLGHAIERASGQSYESYLQDKIFAPLGMTRSMVCRSAADMPGNAYGHGMRAGQSGRVPEIVHTATFAAGSLCSTPQDLVRWLQGLHGGKVLSPAAYAEMTAPAKLNDGTSLRYAMGLYVGTDGNGLPYIGHDGGGFGYSADTRWYRDARIAIVILTNSEPDAITQTADMLVAVLLPVPPAPGQFPGNAALLAGTYKGLGEVVEALLRQTNLWDVRKQKLGGYSGGMRQRFGVAVALLGSPRLMIVDEPTAGLDPAERVRFLNLLSALGEKSVVLLSTHIVEDVSELCTRMAIIDRGEILLEAEPLRAVAELQGRIWRRAVAKEDLQAVERAYQVISTKLFSGRTIVHVYSDTAPAGFEPAEPDLKDVYFSTMAGRIGKRRAQTPARP